MEEKIKTFDDIMNLIKENNLYTNLNYIEFRELQRSILLYIENAFSINNFVAKIDTLKSKINEKKEEPVEAHIYIANNICAQAWIQENLEKINNMIDTYPKKHKLKEQFEAYKNQETYVKSWYESEILQYPRYYFDNLFLYNDVKWILDIEKEINIEFNQKNMFVFFENILKINNIFYDVDEENWESIRKNLFFLTHKFYDDVKPFERFKYELESIIYAPVDKKRKKNAVSGLILKTNALMAIETIDSLDCFNSDELKEKKDELKKNIVGFFNKAEDDLINDVKNYPAYSEELYGSKFVW